MTNTTGLVGLGVALASAVLLWPVGVVVYASDMGVGSESSAPDNQATSELLQGTEPTGVPCGPSAMAYALRILGLPFTNEELADLADEDGLSDFALLSDFADSRGLHSSAVSLTPRDLLQLRHLAVIQLNMAEDKSVPKMHFVVSAGPSSAETVVIYDPVTGNGLRGLCRRCAGPAAALIERALPLVASQPLAHRVAGAPEAAGGGPYAVALGETDQLAADGHFVVSASDHGIVGNWTHGRLRVSDRQMGLRVLLGVVGVSTSFRDSFGRGVGPSSRTGASAGRRAWREPARGRRGTGRPGRLARRAARGRRPSV